METEATVPMGGGGKELELVVELGAATVPVDWQISASCRARDCIGSGDSTGDIDQLLSALKLLSSMTGENDILV